MGLRFDQEEANRGMMLGGLVGGMNPMFLGGGYVLGGLMSNLGPGAKSHLYGKPAPMATHFGQAHARGGQSAYNAPDNPMMNGAAPLRASAPQQPMYGGAPSMRPMMPRQPMQGRAMPMQPSAFRNASATMGLSARSYGPMARMGANSSMYPLI